MTTANSRRGIWQPPAETLEALAAVLRKHWRAAAASRSARLFWSTPSRWLEARTGLATAVTVIPVPVARGQASTWPVTTSLPAAD